jgi:hypothetical protein
MPLDWILLAVDHAVGCYFDTVPTAPLDPYPFLGKHPCTFDRDYEDLVVLCVSQWADKYLRSSRYKLYKRERAAEIGRADEILNMGKLGRSDARRYKIAGGQGVDAVLVTSSDMSAPMSPSASPNCATQKRKEYEETWIRISVLIKREYKSGEEMNEREEHTLINAFAAMV